MKFTRLAIDGPLLIEPTRIGDARGFFSETFRADKFEAEAGAHRFVQDNQSLSGVRGTLRGLHYQRYPKAQGKLVRVLKGAIFDVAIDIRQNSPTFGEHVSVALTDENWLQLWVPPGFLHGFCTLTDEVMVSYKTTEFYSAAHDAGVRWDDPDIGIAWPYAADQLRLSDKDRALPLLRDIGAERG